MIRNSLFSMVFALAANASLALAGVYEDILAAAENNRTEEVVSLLRRGVDVNTTDRDGSSLLLIAARTGNLELTEFLLNNRASIRKPNRYGDTPLHLAVSQGHAPVVQKLIAGGAELNPAGWTPLHYAVFGNHLEIARMLLKHGAELEPRAPNGRTALHLTAQLGRSEMAKLLLSAGADRNAKDFDGLNALDIARKMDFSDLKSILEIE